MNNIAKAIILILISHASAADGKENNHCHLEFGNRSITYHTSKANQDNELKLEPAKGATNYGRSYKRITRVYFCEQNDQTYMKINSNGESFECRIMNLDDENQSPSFQEAVITSWYKDQIEKEEGLFKTNKLHLDNNCPEGFTHYYWPVQTYWNGKECVEYKDQAIFLFKIPNINIAGQNNKDNCQKPRSHQESNGNKVSSSSENEKEQFNGMIFIINENLRLILSGHTDSFNDKNEKKFEGSSNNLRTNSSIPVNAKKQHDIKQSAVNNNQAQAKMLAKKSEYQNLDQTAVQKNQVTSDNNPGIPSFEKLIV